MAAVDLGGLPVFNDFGTAEILGDLMELFDRSGTVPVFGLGVDLVFSITLLLS